MYLATTIPSATVCKLTELLRNDKYALKTQNTTERQKYPTNQAKKNISVRDNNGYIFWLYNELYQQHISLQQTKTLPSLYKQKSIVHYIVTNKKFAIPLSPAAHCYSLSPHT